MVQLPFPLGFLQHQQSAAPPSVDWEAAAKRYSACRAPASVPSEEQQQQQQQQQRENGAGKRKRPSKGSNAVPDEAAEADDVAPPGISLSLCSSPCLLVSLALSVCPSPFLPSLSVIVSADTPSGANAGAEGYAEDGDEIGALLKRADEAPYSYETLHALVSALSAAVSMRGTSKGLP